MRQKRAEMTISGGSSMFNGHSTVGEGGYSVSLGHSDNNSNSSEKTSDMVSPKALKILRTSKNFFYLSFEKY